MPISEEVTKIVIQHKPTHHTTEHVSAGRVNIQLQLLQHLSPSAAMYLTTLLHADACARTEDVANYDGWFSIDRYYVNQLAFISLKRQHAALTVLSDLGIVLVKRSGMPARNFFSINTDQLLNLFGVEYGKTRSCNLF